MTLRWLISAAAELLLSLVAVYYLRSGYAVINQ
jgi:hypothetical protein